MLDIGGWELLIIAAIALIVVGPKDLPRLVRNLGRWVAKARGLARDFQAGMEEVAREADLEDVKKIADAPAEIRRQAREIGESALKGMDPDVDGDTLRDPLGLKGGASARPAPSDGAVNPARDAYASEVGAARPKPAPSARSGPDAEDDAFLDRFERGAAPRPPENR